MRTSAGRWRVTAALLSGVGAVIAWACGGSSGGGAPGPGDDGGAPGDGGACGTANQICCASGCGAGLVCGSAGTCVPSPDACGANGQSCCANQTCNAGLTCTGGACRSGDTGKPCSKNSDCASGECLNVGFANAGVGEPPGADAGSGNVCTTTCTKSSDCVPGWQCLPERTPLCKCQATFEQCDGKDNDCDGVIDNPSTGCLTVLATAQGITAAVVLDDANVYFTNGGQVNKVPKAGGPVVLLAAVPYSDGLAIDATNAYVTERAGTGAVVSVPLAGGATNTISSPEQVPTAIVVDGTNVYWTDAPGGAQGSIKSAPLAGGTVTTLAKNVFQADLLAQDANNLYYVTVDATGEIYTMPKSGAPDGGATLLVPSQNLPSALVVEGDKMFWANRGPTGNGNSIFVAQTDGGGVTTIAKGQAEPVSIALDADYVYWMDGIGPHKAPRGGGPVTTIAWGQGQAGGIAVDATSVYWATSNAIMKRTPK